MYQKMKSITLMNKDKDALNAELLRQVNIIIAKGGTISFINKFEVNRDDELEVYIGHVEVRVDYPGDPPNKKITHYDKLVRDRIPEILMNKGIRIQFDFLSDNDFHKYLMRKLNEEIDEYVHEWDEKELVDIIEIIYALSELEGQSIEELEGLRKKKAKERGVFKNKTRLLLTEEEMEENYG